jgi:MFS family permease
VEGPQNDNWIDKKGMTGMFIQRSISIALFIQTALAYPLIAIHAVGVGTFGVLMALGPLAAIATGPLNGLIADKMSPRNGLIMLSLARAAQVIALPVLAHFALLNFWTLLAMSIANGWQLSLLMTSENAYLRRLAGKNHLGNLNALNAVNYLALQVFLTLILGIGSLIDKLGPMMPYYASAVILPLVVCPIIWFMVPNTMAGAAAAVQTKAAVKSFSEKAKSAVDGAKAFLKKYWKEIGLLGATLGAYLMWHTTLPMSGALFYWVSRTDGFKAVWSQKSLRATMLLSALAFGLIYPFQYMALPLMAGVLGGVAGKAAILGQMTGALFFGQLISNASQTNLPAVKIPFTNYKVPAQRIVQGLVLVLGAAWSLLRLFPGNWPAAVASVAIGSTLMFGASKFTDKGWVKFLGIGLAAASILPLIFWGSLPVMFGAMLALGMFVGPASVALNTYFGKNARSASIGNAFGVNSSLGNTATSFGYGLLTMLVGMFTPVFPHALMPIAVAFMIIGAIFFFLGPKFLPGMADSLFKSKPAAPADKK